MKLSSKEKLSKFFDERPEFPISTKYESKPVSIERHASQI